MFKYFINNEEFSETTISIFKLYNNTIINYYNINVIIV